MKAMAKKAMAKKPTVKKTTKTLGKAFFLNNRAACGI